MRTHCLLSIVIPNYNNGCFIERCLNSILCSERKDFEVIVVDDGSEDNSVDLIKKISDERLRFFTQENQGVSAARNHGIEESKGEFITFCDSDDYYCDGAVSQILGLLDSYCADGEILIFDVYIETKNIQGERSRKRWDTSISKGRVKNTVYFIDGGIYMEMLCGNSGMNSIFNKIYKKTLLSNEKIQFPIGIGIGEDGIFNLRYASCCSNVIYIPEIFYIYCRDESEYASGKIKCNVSTMNELLKGLRIREDIVELYCEKKENVRKEEKKLKRFLNEYAVEQLYHWCFKIAGNNGKKAVVDYLNNHSGIQNQIKEYIKKSVCIKRRLQSIIFDFYFM